MSLEQLIKENGFESEKELHELVSSVDLSTPENLISFKKWQEEDGTKKGLLNLGLNKKVYRSQVIITKNTLQKVPFDHEREFIVSFLRSLPIEHLKTLVNFTEIDFKNPSLWGDSRESNYLYEKLTRLRKLNAVEFNAEIYL